MIEASWRERIADVKRRNDDWITGTLRDRQTERQMIEHDMPRLIEGYKLMAEAVEAIPTDGYCPVCAAQPWMTHLQDNGHGKSCPVGIIIDHLRGVDDD